MQGSFLFSSKQFGKRSSTAPSPILLSILTGNHCYHLVNTFQNLLQAYIKYIIFCIICFLKKLGSYCIFHISLSPSQKAQEIYRMQSENLVFLPHTYVGTEASMHACIPKQKVVQK